MDSFTTNHHPVPAQSQPASRSPNVDGRSDWEDWSEDEPFSAGGVSELLVALDDGSNPSALSRSKSRGIPSRKSSFLLPDSTYTTHKPTRLKSRARQKAQNTRAGIKVVTDMTKFRNKQQQQQQLKNSAEADMRKGQFADLAALQALEGDQNQSSVGSWHWLKKKQNKASPKTRIDRLRAESSSGQDLSPSDRPIMIGIAFPSPDSAIGSASSQTTAAIGDHSDIGHGHTPVQKSIWSPDTPSSADSQLPGSHSRVASSVYSQSGTDIYDLSSAPPVPHVPAAFKHSSPGANEAEVDDDDNFTPVTLFEEDGSPILSRKPTAKSTKANTRSPATAGTAISGWWDHIRTPFLEQSNNNPFARAEPSSATTLPDPTTPKKWWAGSDEKKKPENAFAEVPVAISTPTPNAGSTQARAPAPTTASSSRSNSAVAVIHTPGQDSHHQHQQQSHAEKASVFAAESATPAELPPPYSPARSKGPVRYRAVFPPGHALAETRVPESPGLVSPGLSHTMTSQGAICMTEVPLTPTATHTTAPLPDRLPDTYTTGDQFLAATGDSPAARNERQRRRYEKEEVFARQAGGFWRGRGCFSTSGCFGRSGREGRKRRRVCLGLCGGAIAVIILVVVLAVVLTRKGAEATMEQSIWLNLTNFPPIPTGALTVVGPDNSQDVTTCVQPSTLWSCSLPKEQHESNKPFSASQPQFFLQIQYDNSTQQHWNIPDGQVPVIKPLDDSKKDDSQPSSNGKRAYGRAAAGVRSRLKRDDKTDTNPNFTPNPPLPSFQEMWFLGNWTDGIRSNRKAGEATPFYISFLPSLNATVGANMLSKRQQSGVPSDSGSQKNETNMSPDLASLLPFPSTNADGTAAPAQLFPHPTQQQLRLFDRGLDTEHFGFYSYFNKTIFVRSKDLLNNVTSKLGDVPVDLNGGAARTEARFVAMWAQTRFHVQIWTRREQATRLLGGGGDRRPGTFPYPITVGEDTHGGDPSSKGTYTYELDDRGRPLRENDKIFLQLNHMDIAADLINPRGTTFNPSFGGIDGGTGGCKCAWTNFVGINGNVI